MSQSASLKAKFTILIVDDEQDIREIFEETLKRNGYNKVECVATGEEAIQSLKNKTIDVVMVDLNLPDINGMELISKLRSIGPDTEFIIITGYGTLDSAIKAMQFEVSGYLEKPISTDKLLRSLDEVVEKHNLKLENQLFLENLEKANKEILFLNDLLVNNINALNQSLLLTMVQIEKLNPTNEQRKVLNLFQKAIRKNARLTRNIKKLRSIETKLKEELTEIDLTAAISGVINRLRDDYSDKNFEISYNELETCIVHADRDLSHLLSEIFLIAILNDPSPKIRISLQTAQETIKERTYQKISINAFNMKYIYDQKDLNHPTELLEITNEKGFQDLGPFVINALIRFYEGFVEMPQPKNKNLIDIYLPCP